MCCHRSGVIFVLSFLLFYICLNSLWQPPTSAAYNMITCKFHRGGITSPPCHNYCVPFFWERQHCCHRKHSTMSDRYIRQVTSFSTDPPWDTDMESLTINTPFVYVPMRRMLSPPPWYLLPFFWVITVTTNVILRLVYMLVQSSSSSVGPTQ